MGLLLRTILLLTLQFKLSESNDKGLQDLINKAIGNNVYDDKRITKILSGINNGPKIILDATYHSDWMEIDQSDINVFLLNVKKIVEGTFK